MQETLRYHRLWFFVGLLLVAATLLMSLVPLQMGHSVPHQDKLMHMVGYGGLTLWFLLVMRHHRALIVVPLAMVVLGISVELMQGLTSYRSPEGKDALANALGCMGAALLALTPVRNTLLWLERYLP